ncbi:hypothetical protein HanXRQr2_Chr06g0260341 [Helianthus annuus]|uniref:Uncharacterized protein n=1 Tax=Helianthus annuus TaxID=4232 RepID=A0A9K3ISZ0_HELAN|nr:hypothetical protein HanXRQr2_Chr06g0260341 [Helianthus annuus]KAJ0915568.1 hypothetical protein HanPSC8_Chr06g0251311 [Helianthus annuus]
MISFFVHRSNAVWWQIGFKDLNLKLKTVDGNSRSNSDRRKEYTGVDNRHLR